MNGLENTTLLVGRILMSAIFVHGGWGKLLAAAATQALFGDKLGLPMPMFAWLLAVVVELGGGLLLLVGLFTRPVGLVLAAWCVATALIAHTNLADRAQEINFYKNMAMTGGFLYVFAFGAGAYSLDALWWRRRSATVPG
jgi:putative oxidoreductase